MLIICKKFCPFVQLEQIVGPKNKNLFAIVLFLFTINKYAILVKYQTNRQLAAHIKLIFSFPLPFTYVSAPIPTYVISIYVVICILVKIIALVSLTSVK